MFLEKDQGNLGQNVGAKNSSAGAVGEIRIQILRLLCHASVLQLPVSQC